MTTDMNVWLYFVDETTCCCKQSLGKFGSTKTSCQGRLLSTVSHFAGRHIDQNDRNASSKPCVDVPIW